MQIRSGSGRPQVFKILTGKEDVDPTCFFHMATTNLKGHRMKIFKQRSRLNPRKNFFSQRVVNYWNSLPSNVVEATSTNSFKNRIDKYWRRWRWEDIKAQGLYLP